MVTPCRHCFGTIDQPYRQFIVRAIAEVMNVECMLAEKATGLSFVGFAIRPPIEREWRGGGRAFLGKGCRSIPDNGQGGPNPVSLESHLAWIQSTWTGSHPNRSQSFKRLIVHLDILSTPSPRMALTGMAARLPRQAFFSPLGCLALPDMISPR